MLVHERENSLRTGKRIKCGSTVARPGKNSSDIHTSAVSNSINSINDNNAILMGCLLTCKDYLQLGLYMHAILLLSKQSNLPFFCVDSKYYTVRPYNLNVDERESQSSPLSFVCFIWKASQLLYCLLSQHICFYYIPFN